MSYLFSKPLTLAAFMALGLVGCNNSNQTATETAPADDATTTEPAANTNGTLQKIKDSGTIVVGHRDSSIPFSYIADDAFLVFHFRFQRRNQHLQLLLF